MFTFKERQELNALSKEVLGKTSRWYNRIFLTGALKAKEERTLNPKDVSVRYYLDFNSIKEYLLHLQKLQQELLAEMKDKATKLEPDSNKG